MNDFDNNDIDDDDVFDGLGIEVTLKNKEDFLKIVETLTRIGIVSKKDKTLFQTANLLHKKGKYAIMHFKEMFALDGRNTDISDNDIARRNTICRLLKEWELLEIVDEEEIKEPQVNVSEIKILSFSEKNNYNLVQKYKVGRKK